MTAVPSSTGRWEITVDLLEKAWAHSLLGRFTAESQATLRAAGRMVVLASGADVRLGDLVLVLDGLVAVQQRMEGRRVTLRYAGPGELSGVGALLGGLELELRPLTATRAFVIPGALFVTESRRFARNALETARDVSAANAQVLAVLADHVFLPMPSRIARHLLDRTDLEAPGALAIRATNAAIADSIGTVPAVVGRALSTLESQGLIRREPGSRIVILDPVQLNRLHASSL